MQVGLALFLLPVFYLTSVEAAWGDGLPDYGVSGYSCPDPTMRRSKVVPTSAHSVRVADINVIAGLGDSLTAGNGAGAEDPVAILLQYRGLTSMCGMDKTLEEHVTIPNVMRKYNPNLFGGSKGIGTANVWEIAQLNLAQPGARSDDLPRQAREVVARMQAHNEVDFENDWKMVAIFIGGNDMCAYCKDHTGHSPQHFADGIRQAIQILYDQVPRVIVSMVSMFHFEMLRRIDTGQVFCQALHVSECGCESNVNFTNAEIAEVCVAYQEAQMQLQTSGMFDQKDDFTLVIQPFMNEVTVPPMKDGHPDLSFFAPDCFHFSQYGHAVGAVWGWNNALEPVGMKNLKANLSMIPPLACPDPNCPFIRTTKNSANCAMYMTEPADQ